MKPKILIGICLMLVAAGTYFLKVQRTPDITRPNTPPELPTRLMTAKTEDDFIAAMLAEAQARLPSDYILTLEEREGIKSRAGAMAMRSNQSVGNDLSGN